MHSTLWCLQFDFASLLKYVTKWALGTGQYLLGGWDWCILKSVKNVYVLSWEKTNTKKLSYYCWGGKKLKFYDYFSRKEHVSYRFLHRSQYWNIDLSLKSSHGNEVVPLPVISNVILLSFCYQMICQFTKMVIAFWLVITKLYVNSFHL